MRDLVEGATSAQTRRVGIAAVAGRGDGAHGTSHEERQHAGNQDRPSHHSHLPGGAPPRGGAAPSDVNEQVNARRGSTCSVRGSGPLGNRDPLSGRVASASRRAPPACTGRPRRRSLLVFADGITKGDSVYDLDFDAFEKLETGSARMCLVMATNCLNAAESQLSRMLLTD